ncbi:MBL fold metallo-hydrolase, partial [Candidatus Bipolaricaulota bacterium]|nr:MBL fold metallo-hydrolase [Candidatus Bipolaricaulota bacterium]
MSVLPIGLTFVKSFLITGETQELVLVDAGTPGDGDRIADRIRELGYRLEDVALIVLTHGHSDHVGGVRRLKELTHAEILIHSRDAGILQEGIESPVVPLGARGRFLRLFTGLTGQKSDYT